jgi:hypothetical protein
VSGELFVYLQAYLDLVIGPLLPVLRSWGTRCGAIHIGRRQVGFELTKGVVEFTLGLAQRIGTGEVGQKNAGQNK